MDYRLDLYNAIENYGNNISEEDAMILICHNYKDGYLLIAQNGDVNILSAALANDGGKYLIMPKKRTKRNT